MYLVHVHLRSRSSGDLLPEWTATAIADCAAGLEGFEHVSVHAEAFPQPVLGIYLRAPTLEAAEAGAEALCRRVWSCHQALTAWEVVRAEVPLLPDANL
ncbi:hypothetical protein [Streptomyces sp. NBC_00344]|uniref:hypothetical protein n=1 Tax=Streptomyces sp. NBC_00344 TaxID=2975720 RepID=UPI002E1C9527